MYFGIIRDFIIPVILVLFINIPIVQTGALGIIMFSDGVMNLKIKPKKENLDNYVEGFTRVMYGISSVFFSILSLMEDGKSLSFKYYFIGYPIITALTSIIIVNFGIMLYKSGLALVNGFKYIKNLRKNKKVNVAQDTNQSRSTIANDSMMNLNMSEATSPIASKPKKTLQRTFKKNRETFSMNFDSQKSQNKGFEQTFEHA